MSDTGVFQLKNGNWAFRYKITIDGKVKDSTSRRDINGNPYKTKKEAMTAREALLYELKSSSHSSTHKEVSLEYIYNLYSSSSTAKTKAPATLRKQESLWENHVKKSFGSCLINSITISELYNYLVQLYNNGDEFNNFSSGYSFKYVESFLKFFYLLFGEADRMELIDSDRYYRMFVNKGTRLKMPPITQEDADEEKDIKIFDVGQLSIIQQTLKDTNAETAFMLGYYLGVRVSECYGLLWSDVDWEQGTIKICRQMHVEDGGVFVLRPCKTLTSSRIIEMGDILQKYLWEEHKRQEAAESTVSWFSHSQEIVIDKTSKTPKTIQGGDFINRCKDGTLCTVNSLKYWSRILSKKNIDFKYHSLRKTHLSRMASLGTPVPLLMQRAGHKKIETTLRYYIDSGDEAKQIYRKNLTAMSLDNSFWYGSDGV